MGNFDENKDVFNNFFNLSINTDNLESTRCALDFIYFLKYVITITYDGEEKYLPTDWPYIVKLAKMLVNENRLVVLKGRQMLCSWVIVAYSVWVHLNKDNLIVLILSKGEDAAQEMIRRAYQLYDRLPDFLRNLLPLKDGPRNKGQIEFDKRGRIVALPSKADAARSVSAKIVFIDEAAYARELDDMLAAIEPLLGENSKLFIVSTPNGKMIGRSFTNLCKEAEAKGYRRFDLPYRLCPPYRDPEWEKKKRQSMTPQKFAHEYELSLATAGDAMIFPEISEKNDWDGDFVPNENHKIYRCIDPGEKMACIWLAEDPIGNVIAYRELYMHGGSYENRAKRIKQMSGEEIYEASIIDSAAPEAKRELSVNGVYCRNCLRKDVYETIDQINCLIKGQATSENPCLYITNACPKLKQQMRDWIGDDCGYPVKNQYDHGVDSLRYGVQLIVRVRKNRGSSLDVPQQEDSLDIDKELELEMSSDTMSRGSGIDHSRDFSEADFGLGGI